MEEDNIIKMSKAGYLYMFVTLRLRRCNMISIYRISHADSCVNMWACVDMWALSNMCSLMFDMCWLVRPGM